ncbi:hypothetical protein AVEN_254541-1 [Araneus ventricosus]|uniref:Transposable element P transposase-like GTP-binding insertion domain-containing protein n=1 Tax=Araneus ventricosus TaxID=182803 RepID=A0A4Y2M949_ARAVE|nr:hypothetical protein AVEN_254541-1 [Araneus ventricosus]
MGEILIHEMKVGPAHVLINNSVAVALRYYVNLKKLDESALATAWFIEIVARWFDIVTSRSYSVSLSLSKRNCDETVAFLESVIWLLSNLKIGIRGVWKPVQAGIVLTTTSMLALQEMYLKDHKFKFILLSRFSQDAIENLFSPIRLKNPVPNCKEFKTCLRLIILSQNLTSGVKGNSFSDADEEMGTPIFQLYSENKNFIAQEFSDESVLSFDIDFEKSEIEVCYPKSDFLNITYAEKLCFDIDFDKADMEMHNEIALPKSEENSLFYLCGCIGKILSRSKLCPTCIGTLSDNSNCSNDNIQMFSKMKKFRRDVNSLVYVSEEVFTVLKHVENLFMSNEEKVLKSELVLSN